MNIKVEGVFFIFVKNFSFIDNSEIENPYSENNQKKKKPILNTDEDFIEIDIEKKIENLTSQTNQNDSFLEKFRIVNDIAPLVVHDIYKHKLENHQELNKNEKKLKNQKSKEPEGSVFLIEKLEKQIAEAKQKRLEMKMRKKNFSNSEKKPIQSGNKLMKEEGIDEVLT